jgi:hypothetical protein
MKNSMSIRVLYSVCIFFLALALFLASWLKSNGYQKIEDLTFESNPNYSDSIEEGPAPVYFEEITDSSFFVEIDTNELSYEFEQGISVQKVYPDIVDMNLLPEKKIDTCIKNAKEVKIGAPPIGWEKLKEIKDKELEPDDDETNTEDKE